EALRAEGERALGAVRTTAELEAARVRYLGRKSELTGILRGLKDLPPAERSRVGAAANQARVALESLLGEAEARVGSSETHSIERDVTLPGRRPPLGHRHLVHSVIREIEEIFHGLGFSVASGPEVEDDYHNFGALNMPEGHPARAMTDTFYLKPGVL